MYYASGTSEAYGDLGDRVRRLDIMLETERKILNLLFFILPVILVLLVAGVAWKLVKPGMSTYDSTVVLVVFLIAGFLMVFSMLAFVLLWLKQVLSRMEVLHEQIDDKAFGFQKVDSSSLPELDWDSFPEKFQNGNDPSSN